MTSVGPGDQPRPPDGRTRIPAINRVVVVAVAAALVAGAVSGLAIGRLIGEESDVDAQDGDTDGQAAEIERLTAVTEEHQAEIERISAEADGYAEEVTSLTTQLDDRDTEVEEMTAEIDALEGQLETLEAEKGTLQEQLDQFLNPPVGPSPTAELRVAWVRRYTNDEQVVACVQIKNTSATDLDFYYSSNQFSAFDGDNKVFPPVTVYAGQIEFAIAEGQLGAGETRRGKVLFEVPTGSRVSRLVWAAGFGATPEVSVNVQEERRSFQLYPRNHRC